MDTCDVAQAVTALGGCCVDTLDHDGLGDAISTSATVRAWLDACDIRLARRARELHDAGRSDAPGPMFGRAGKVSSRQGENTARREETATAMPSFEHDLDQGKISAEYLDVISDIRRKLTNDARAEFDTHHHELLGWARNERVDTFARRCRELARRITASFATNDAEELDRQRANSTIKRWIDKITGMHVTKLELDPVRDAALWSAIDAMTNTLRHRDGNANTPWSQLQIHALLALVANGVVSGATVSESAGEAVRDTPDGAGDSTERVHDRRVPEIMVVVDLATLVDGLHDRTMCETEDGTPLPVSTARRLCCDAEVFPVVLGGDGMPLDVGRSARTVTRSQRRALRAMHRTCAHPDCTVPFSACRAHHVKWWWKHMGRTDLDNLLPLCERHHHLVHEGEWGLTMTPDRVTTWYRPDGSTAHHGPSPDRTRPPPRR